MLVVIILIYQTAFISGVDCNSREKLDFMTDTFDG